MLRSQWKYAVAGAPCEARKRTDTGVHAGVLFLSRLPARALPHTFSADVYATARVQVVGMAVADTWVTVGMVYGLPCNATHKQARFQTDAILAEVVDRVACQAAGPRAIGGDFNYGPDELEQLNRLRALGFREVQDLRAWQFGVSAEPTGSFGFRLSCSGLTGVQVWNMITGPIMLLSVQRLVMRVCVSLSLRGISLLLSRGRQTGLVLWWWISLMTPLLLMLNFGLKWRDMPNVGLNTMDSRLPSLNVAGRGFCKPSPLVRTCVQ